MSPQNLYSRACPEPNSGIKLESWLLTNAQRLAITAAARKVLCSSSRPRLHNCICVRSYTRSLAAIVGQQVAAATGTLLAQQEAKEAPVNGSAQEEAKDEEALSLQAAGATRGTRISQAAEEPVADTMPPAADGPPAVELHADASNIPPPRGLQWPPPPPYEHTVKELGAQPTLAASGLPPCDFRRGGRAIPCNRRVIPCNIRRKGV